jgi:hypothetical protein
MTFAFRRLAASACAPALAAILAACGGGSDDNASAPSAVGALQVTTLSSKPEFASGGTTLVQVAYPAGASASNVRLTLNGTDVTARLATVDTTARTLRGVVPGLTTNASLVAGSPNDLVASDATGAAAAASLRVFNFPITGPILSGPQLAPYECRTVQNGLGNPLDGNCSATTKVQYYYRATNNTFKTLADPTAARPSDLVTATTNDGRTVPYIVRVETGTINRGVYNLAVLDDPAVGSPLPATFVPGAGWNRKLVIAFGGGGGASFNQGVQGPTTALANVELSRGFAYANSTELINQQHANPFIQTETVMMLKEHVIKTFGPLKWTVGTGGSGGAIQQHQIAQHGPGLLDGLQPNSSFPETFMQNVYECRLANEVFKSDPARWTGAKQIALQGFNAGTCNSWDLAFASYLMRSDFAAGCAVTEPANVARIYNATSNPTGNLFCSFFDANTNLFGKDGSGRARRPADNIGVQYGLAALNAGTLTKAEFLDFNQQVGGMDRDGYGPAVAASPVPGLPAARMAGDLEAIRLAWAGGFKNSFTGAGFAVPIVTQRTNASLTGDIHDTTQDLIVRARLAKGTGRSDNQIILTSSAQAAAAGFGMTAFSIDVLNAWLDAIAADPAPASTDKVVRLKPALATDACWDTAGVRIAETASLDNTTRCNTIYPRFSTLRLVAGESLAQDGVKCTLKPVNQNDYGVTFNNAELVRLNQIFPDGVCDWTKPGVNQVAFRGPYQRVPFTN